MERHAGEKSPHKENGHPAERMAVLILDRRFFLLTTQSLPQAPQRPVYATTGGDGSDNDTAYVGQSTG